jgi:hypothetical protein
MIRKFLLTSMLIGLLSGAFSGRAEAFLLIGPTASVNCTTAANTFLARNTGTPNATAIRTLVCALVGHGLITGDLTGTSNCGSKFDAIWILATDTDADATFNLCGTANRLTENGLGGALSFTANAGFTTTGGTGYLLSPILLTGLSKYSLTSAHFSAWSLTSVSPALAYIGSTADDAGGEDQAQLRIVPKYIDNNMYCSINSPNTSQVMSTIVPTSTDGLFMCSRNGTTLEEYYNNTMVGTGTFATTFVPSARLPAFLGIYSNGSVLDSFLGTVGFISLGSGLSSTDEGNLYTDVCAYLTTVHGSC